MYIRCREVACSVLTPSSATTFSCLIKLLASGVTKSVASGGKNLNCTPSLPSPFFPFLPSPLFLCPPLSFPPSPSLPFLFPPLC